MFGVARVNPTKRYLFAVDCHVDCFYLLAITRGGSVVVAEKLEQGRILPSLESLKVALRLMESQELVP
ncbi:MAG TPA: hypothetical protein DHV68_05415 [Dehalococcoidia bacterium]|nr:hypothetical protein [Chloroflexota bacterium]HCI86264.1 hypothetical protein [Dehalococcoidia bacterium]